MTGMTAREMARMVELNREISIGGLVDRTPGAEFYTPGTLIPLGGYGAYEGEALAFKDATGKGNGRLAGLALLVGLYLLSKK